MKQIVTNPSFAAFVKCEGEELESRFKEIVESILQLNELNHRLKDATLFFTEMELKLLLRQPGGAEKNKDDRSYFIGKLLALIEKQLQRPVYVIEQRENNVKTPSGTPERFSLRWTGKDVEWVELLNAGTGR